MSELGARLREARQAAKISLSAMAARTHYSKPYLSQIENGRRTVQPEHVTAYSRALGVPVASLYGQPQDPLRIAHEWLLADTPVTVHSAAGRRVGASLAAELERRVIELRHLDDTVGGDDLYPLVDRELAAAARVVTDASYSEPVGRRLLTVVGELAQLAGWVASDAGRYAEAEYVYLNGVSAAQASGDHALAGQLLSSLSYQMANVGNPADAALLARSAVKGANGASPVTRALLLERVAWASARSRDIEATRQALDDVDNVFESRSDGESEPEWTYWLDRDEIDVMAGRCLIEIGEPARAEPLISAAVAGYAPEHARETALYQTWIAEAYAKSGELDAARAALTKARKGADKVNSTRLQVRISSVDTMIGRIHR
jgi:transcriptional regulator with XRE-family HTH domain